MRKRGKRMLNDSHEEFGTVAWYVDPTKDYAIINSELIIRDCISSITLDFTSYKESDKKKRIEKLDSLIDELQNMRKALEKASAKKKFYY